MPQLCPRSGCAGPGKRWTGTTYRESRSPQRSDQCHPQSGLHLLTLSPLPWLQYPRYAHHRRQNGDILCRSVQKSTHPTFRRSLPCLCWSRLWPGHSFQYQLCRQLYHSLLSLVNPSRIKFSRICSTTRCSENSFAARIAFSIASALELP